MVKEKIANLIAYVGVILGILTGIAVTRAELYLSPISYIESYMGLAYYFYYFLSMIAIPFLMVRVFIRTKHKKSVSLSLLLSGIILALLFWYDRGFGQEIFVIIISLAFSILLADFLLKDGRRS